jgi:hypothetical protein
LASFSIVQFLAASGQLERNKPMSNTEWVLGHDAWGLFTERHPELALKPGFWTFHNFLRLHRAQLLSCDAIRKARGRWWIAHAERFPSAAFDCATGAFRQERDL